eukprot:478131-Prymnesium_polylepis.3
MQCGTLIVVTGVHVDAILHEQRHLHQVAARRRIAERHRGRRHRAPKPRGARSLQLQITAALDGDKLEYSPHLLARCCRASDRVQLEGQEAALHLIEAADARGAGLPRQPPGFEGVVDPLLCLHRRVENALELQDAGHVRLSAAAVQGTRGYSDQTCTDTRSCRAGDPPCAQTCQALRTRPQRRLPSQSHS